MGDAGQQPQPQPAQPMDPAQLPDSYAFVMNVGAIRDAASLPLVQGHELRRATPREVAEIRERLEQIRGFSLNPMIWHVWEYELSPMGVPRNLLPQDQWRYFVIGFRGNNITLVDLERAFDLAPVELEVAFTVIYSPYGGGMLFNPGRVFQALSRVPLTDDFFVDVGSEQTEEIASIHNLIQNHDHTVLDLRRILAEPSALKRLPRESPLLFLGYFALIESLLTHPPNSEDRYESITRQIKKKLILLDNRMSRRIDYSPFGGASPETVWTRMYECRSIVAHGGQPDFTRGSLHLLQNYDNAFELVKETAKAVLLQALREPRF